MWGGSNEEKECTFDWNCHHFKSRGRILPHLGTKVLNISFAFT